LIPKYLGTEAIQVVEGGVPEVTELLNQKWDKIFYTGTV
jgi:aldehyde dehydrogenase (NAD+)